MGVVDLSSKSSSSSSSSRSSSLAPGFRFHPTDEELVRYYLWRKVCRKPLRVDAISQINIYKAEPWDLPGKSRLKTGDLEWYFFSVPDKKYGNGSKTNRATDRGYWKTTGKDKAVYHKSLVVGMKKTLVFHSGRAPRGERTNWVMHEYRLVDEELEKAGIIQDAFVLCRVFQKSGSGPKNGEQYGAPFVDQEWEDDELDLRMIPKEEAAEEVVVGDEAYLVSNDFEQILVTNLLSQDTPVPFNFYSEESKDDIDDAQKPFVGVGENQYCLEQPDDGKLFDLPEQYDGDANPVEHEFVGESSQTINLVDMDYFLDEPFLDASDNPQFDDGPYLETDDLSNLVEADPLGYDMLQEYLTYFDADGDSLQYIDGYDSSRMIESGNLVSDQSSLTHKHVNGETQQVDTSSQQLLEKHVNNIATSSKQELTKFGAGSQNSFVNRMLGSIPAPPAFASEFPSKDSVVHLNSTSRSASSVHVTDGMMQIRNMTLSASGADWSSGKHNFNIVVAFDLSRSDGNSGILEPMVRTLSGKDRTTVFLGWIYFIFVLVLIVSTSIKFETCIFAR